jgi:FKBP-type peptidyl-prolyl cis-trans isomerase FklB
MKLSLIVLLGLGTALGLSNAAELPYKTTKEKASYALGLNIGKQLKQNNAEIDPEIYIKAVKDTLAGVAPLMTEEQMREVLTSWQMELRTNTLVRNRKEGEQFLAANKSKEGVQIIPVTLGTNTYELQYKVETKGTGKIPGSNDTVVCHYRGTMIDGTEFDSSYKRGEPTSFAVGGVIKGWTEALLKMPVGSKWKLFIPSDLAYGERGNRGIAPNSTLLFDIELVSIKDPNEAVATPPIQVQPVPTPGNKPK